MATRRFRPVRALRVLLACAFLWIGASAAAPRDAWNDAAVVVVASASAHGDERHVIETEVQAEPESVTTGEVSRAATPRPEQARVRRPTRDLYLRHCALLC